MTFLDGLVFAQDVIDASELIKWGPFALAFGLAIVGYVRFKPEVDSLRADKDRADAQLRTLTDEYTKTVIPVLSAAVEAIRETTRRVEASTESQTRVAESIAAASARLERVERILQQLPGTAEEA